MSRPIGDVGIDLRNFERGLLAWAQGVGVDLPTAVKKQAIHLLRAILRLLPPKSLAQGRKAVARDLRRAALPIFFQPRSDDIAEMVAENDIAGLNAIINKSGGALEGFTVVPFDERLHSEARGSKGRVRGSQKKAIIDHSAWRAYFARVTKRVGKAKGSLAGSLLRLGQSVPGWIARHAPHGYTIDRTTDSKNPIIKIGSKVEYLRDLDFFAIARAAVRAREKAMAADLRRQIRHRARKAGLGK